MAKIFCIDDDRAVLKLLSTLLRDAGHDVVEATNGHEALDMMPSFKPDIIICDVEMPDMDGFQFLHALRDEHHELDDIPFVFMSSHDNNGDLVAGLELGADDYLIKPVKKDYLMAKVKAFLRQMTRMGKKKEQEQVKIYKSLSKKLSNVEVETFEAYDTLLERLESEYEERLRLKEMLTELKSKLQSAEYVNEEALNKIAELENSLDTALKGLLTVRAQVKDTKKTLSEGMSIHTVQEQLDSITKSVDVTIIPIQFTLGEHD